MTPVAFGLRGLVLVASLGLCLLTAIAAVGVPWVGLGLLVSLACVSAVRPDSWWPMALLALHGVVWVATVPVPTTWTGWAEVLLAAVLALLVHLGSAWAGSVPPRAEVPTDVIRTWVIRAVTVTGVAVVVWGLTVVTANRPAGEASALTAVTAAILLASAGIVWRLQRR